MVTIKKRNKTNSFSTKKYLKYAVLALLIITVIYTLGFTNAVSLLTEENLRNFIDQFGLFGPVVFGLLYFALTLAFVSAVVMTILSGLLFGKFLGTVVVVISATAAATTAFFLGRYFGKDLVNKVAGSKRVGPWIKKIEKQCEHNGFQAFFIMRCLFLPYMPLSYAAGLVRSAKAWDFVLATFITNGIFSFFFVYLGDNLTKGPKALILPILLIILAFQVPKVIKKFRKTKQTPK